MVNFLRWLIFQYLFHPTVTTVTVAVKDPGHTAKSASGRLQLNTHAYYMWLQIKWHCEPVYQVVWCTQNVLWDSGTFTCLCNCIHDKKYNKRKYLFCRIVMFSLVLCDMHSLCLLDFSCIYLWMTFYLDVCLLLLLFNDVLWLVWMCEECSWRHKTFQCNCIDTWQ